MLTPQPIRQGTYSIAMIGDRYLGDENEQRQESATTAYVDSNNTATAATAHPTTRASRSTEQDLD
jgi:hypothetical protein